MTAKVILSKPRTFLLTRRNSMAFLVAATRSSAIVVLHWSRRFAGCQLSSTSCACAMVSGGGGILSRIILADLKGRGGYVNKDTVAGGYGSRFQGHSFTTRFEKHVRRVMQNLPSIHIGYLASIFAAAGHEVIVTRSDAPIDGDLAIVLTSLVDFRHER